MTKGLCISYLINPCKLCNVSIITSPEIKDRLGVILNTFSATISQSNKISFCPCELYKIQHLKCQYLDYTIKYTFNRLKD